MANQYLKINWNESDQTYIPTKTTIETLISNLETKGLQTMKANNFKDALAKPTDFPIGETMFFSNNPTNKFFNLSYATVQTIHGYNSNTGIQYIYDYFAKNNTIKYRMASYSETTWGDWQEISIVGHKHTKADISDMPTSLPSPGTLTFTGGATGTYNGASNVSIAIPKNTDTKVTQAATITTKGAYPILLGYSTLTTAVTNTVNKASTFTYNPNTYELKNNDISILKDEIKHTTLDLSDRFTIANRFASTTEGASTYSSKSLALICDYRSNGSTGTSSYGVVLSVSYGGGPAIVNFSPITSTTNPKYNLGSPTYKWNSIYANVSTIQTSNRSDKSDIHYLDENIRTRLVTSEQFTTKDIISFINTLKPAVFVYKQNEENNILISDAIANNNTESVQLGLIADDIKDEPLFNYVGATMEYDTIIEPEEKDENGNIIKEAVKKKNITLGLKAIPLAVTALTACKYLLSINKQLKSRIENLELKLF